MIPITNHAVERYQQRFDPDKSKDEVKDYIWSKILPRTEAAIKFLTKGQFHIGEDFTVVVNGGVIVTVYDRLQDRFPQRRTPNFLKRKGRMTSKQKRG